MITIFIRSVLPMPGLGSALGVLVGLPDAPAVGSDAWLHLRFGQEFLSDWSLGHPGHLGPFDSGTWYTTQWLSQIAMASVDSVFGLGGVIWLAGVLVLLLPIVLHLIGRWYVAAPGCPGRLSGYCCRGPGLSARPQILSYLLIAIVTATCPEIVAARREDSGTWAVHVVRHGRLAAAGVIPRGGDAHHDVHKLTASAETVPDAPGPVPAATAEESERILRWLESPGIRLVDVEVDWVCPLAGAGRHLSLYDAVNQSRLSLVPFDEQRLPGTVHRPVR